MVNMKAVKSSQIHSIGFDPGSRALHVKFNSSPDSLYVYGGVPAALHNSMMKAPSVGKFFNSRVKGKFDFSKS